MKTFKFLMIAISLIIYTGFKTNKEKKYKYYYYAYATTIEHDKSINKFVSTGNVYITSLLFIETSFITEARISNQFRDYMKANYNANIGKVESKLFQSDVFNKAKATEYLRKTKKRFNKIYRINDFEYLKD